jgi:hypothetical protein
LALNLYRRHRQSSTSRGFHSGEFEKRKKGDLKRPLRIFAAQFMVIGTMT